MATTHKPFRELAKPNSNFEFVNRQRLFLSVSVFLVVASIAMLFVNKQVRGDYLNWSIDFKGGTEMIWQFRDKSGAITEVSTNDVRSALGKGGFDGVDVSDFSWAGKDDKPIPGMLTRTRAFGALDAAKAEEIREAFNAQFKDRNILTSRWSGDRLFVRSAQPIKWEEASGFFDKYEKGWLKEWLPDDAKNFAEKSKGTGEYNAEYTVWGLDRQFKSALERGLGNGIKAEVVNVYGVGAKAGEQLRNDGIKSLFYAMALVMLYLAFRFDVRYAPGAVIALLHDAIVVVGVFALTWTEVSLTTVAALLTVIGYSVNDTVVIYDRIRENVDRLKDKKLPRVVNISLNEILQRSLLTSITTFMVTLAMNIFGTGLVRNFALAMNIGVVVGTYSSVFMASPIFLWIDRTFYPSKMAGRGKSKTKARRRARVDEPIEASEDEIAEADAELAAKLSDDAEDESAEAEGPKRRRPRKKRKRRK